jgi:methylated-DNA-[protein]-cysteine S-methyltransferase
MDFYDSYQSPIGTLYLVFSGRRLTSIRFDRPSVRAGRAPDPFRRELDAYFRGKLRAFTQEIHFTSGTEFEKRVWSAILDVPYGRTVTYKMLAEKVGSPRASRAVGQALARNPIPIVVPCHRVVESGGGLGGYSPGAGIKERLLKMEYYYSMSAEGGPAVPD